MELGGRGEEPEEPLWAKDRMLLDTAKDGSAALKNVNV